jgi:hypothetical protein
MVGGGGVAALRAMQAGLLPGILVLSFLAKRI